MQLKDLQPQWSERTRSKKLEIIEASNERRIKSFEIKKSKKRKSSKKKKKSKKSTVKTAEGLARLMMDMTPDERENFKLMVQMRQGK